MLFLLSPAKSLDFESPLGAQAHSAPLFAGQSKVLIDVLRGYTPVQIAQLMDLSDTLSGLNVARYQAWSTQATPKNARQALLAFNGDVYDGLNARSLDADALDEIPFSGTQFDVGEAVAQSLALAIDPFATGPGAERVRESGLLGAPAESPFAVLKGLKPKA